MSWRGIARRSLPYIATATTGFLLAYLLVAFVIFPARIIPSDTKVPAVVGLPYDDAAGKLSEAGFRPARGEQRYHASAPAGVVLDQSPAAGSVEPKGTTVSLDVSRGQRTADVPSMVGLTRQQAEQALEGSGLDEGQVIEQANDAPRGQVIGSTPSGGTKVPLPSAVSLIVSKGPSEVAVPDLVGNSLSQARLLLDQVGLKIGVVTPDSLSTMPVNTIVAQSPAAGRTVGPGTRVAVTISGTGAP